MNRQVLVVPVLILFFGGLVDAGSITMEEETQYLLEYIGNSSCTFTRNGKVYQPDEARSHIQRKYKHVKKKVQTTEQVIKYAATKSSISGKVYTIKCPGEAAVPSAEWLSSELARFRSELE